LIRRNKNNLYKITNVSQWGKFIARVYILMYFGISAPPVLDIFACSAYCFIINVKTWEQNESMHAEQ